MAQDQRDNINDSLDRRRDDRDYQQTVPTFKQTADITHGLIAAWQPALQIMASACQVYAHALRGMSEAFEDAQREQLQQQQRRRTG